MPDDFPRDRPHLLLRNNGEREPYRRPNQIITPPALPARERAAHAEALTEAVGQALAAAREQMATRDAGVAVGTPGFYLEVQLPGSERAGLDLLANRRQRIEVVAVREAGQPGEPLLAAVFVPARAENYYLRKIEAYRTADTRSGRPRNEPLITRIDTVRLATVRSLCADLPDRKRAHPSTFLRPSKRSRALRRDHRRGNRARRNPGTAATPRHCNGGDKCESGPGSAFFLVGLSRPTLL